MPLVSFLGFGTHLIVTKARKEFSALQAHKYTELSVCSQST